MMVSQYMLIEWGKVFRKRQLAEVLKRGCHISTERICRGSDEILYSSDKTRGSSFTEYTSRITVPHEALVGKNRALVKWVRGYCN